MDDIEPKTRTTLILNGTIVEDAKTSVTLEADLGGLEVHAIIRASIEPDALRALLFKGGTDETAG